MGMMMMMQMYFTGEGGRHACLLKGSPFGVHWHALGLHTRCTRDAIAYPVGFAVAPHVCCVVSGYELANPISILISLLRSHYACDALAEAMAHQQFCVVPTLQSFPSLPILSPIYHQFYVSCVRISAGMDLQDLTLPANARRYAVSVIGLFFLGMLQEFLSSYRAKVGMQAAKASQSSSADMTVNLTSGRCNFSETLTIPCCVSDLNVVTKFPADLSCQAGVDVYDLTGRRPYLTLMSSEAGSMNGSMSLRHSRSCTCQRAHVHLCLHMCCHLAPTHAEQSWRSCTGQWPCQSPE